MANSAETVTFVNFSDEEALVIEASPNAERHARAEDGIESVEYNIDYRSERGRLSTYLKVQYADGTVRDVPMDTITQSQPQLWEAKQKALKVMDDYNATFILAGAFPVVWQILTMGTSITPVTEMRGVGNKGMLQRSFPKLKQPEVLESKGAVRPGRPDRTHTDPFTGETHPIMATAKTERSMVTSIRADVAESEAYKAALFVRKEIGLQRPTGANVAGVDFITVVLRPGTRKVQEVLANDVKASVAGKFPVPKTSIPGAWRAEIRNAVAPARLNLGDKVLEAEIRTAVQQGRVRLRQINVNYSSQGQGQMTGW